ncbi:MAG: hypothetical protein ABIP03_04955 [Aquihabitans sp.]
MNTVDANAFLLEGGARSAKFETPGDKITGKVVSAEVAQQTDISDNTPKTWDNGDPMMQLIVTLQTDLDEGDDDDGKRRLYLKGSKNKATSSLGAVKAAIKNAGAPGIAEGGTLSMAYTGDGEVTKRGFNAPKEYAAKYTAPAPVDKEAVDDIFGD